MRLSDYPYVLVRFSCTTCRRRGQMRLARLAEKYGARCGIFLPDLGAGGPPPDVPPVGLRLVKPDAAE